MEAELVRKNLKTFNLKTTNAMLIKLITIMYLHDISNSTKIYGVTHRAQESENHKTLRMSQKFRVFTLISTNFWTTLKTATHIMHYFALHYW